MKVAVLLLSFRVYILHFPFLRLQPFVVLKYVTVTGSYNVVQSCTVDDFLCYEML